jgi:enoyl-CoA hydratase
LSVHMNIDHAIALIELDRPEQLNALTPSLFMALRDCIRDIRQGDRDVRAVIIKGRGRAFCAGFDLKVGRIEMQELREKGTPLGETFMGDTIAMLAGLPMPVIACVHGYCMTGGLELALAADIIVASDDAVFADTHAKIGLNARWGMTQRLPRRIGLSRAKEMMFSARRIMASEAFTIGLADKLVPPADLDEAVLSMARDIAANSAESVRRIKMLVDQSAEIDLEAGLMLELSTHPNAAVLLAAAGQRKAEG